MSDDTTNKTQDMLPLIAAGLALLNTLVVQIAKWREQAIRTKELTPEQDAEFDAALEEMFKKAHWQPKA